MRFLTLVLASGGRVSRKRRALWLHRSCSRIRKRLSLRLIVDGTPPVDGLIASNHLSYLDVLFYGALAPYGFVAKAEVRFWPLFGPLARAGDTVFVDRGRGAQSVEAAQEIEQRLHEGMPVLLFAEGTSSDGAGVLPFRSSLFEPAIRANARVTPAAICYYSDEAPESRISYWGTMVFFPHLFRTLCLEHLGASIHFGQPKHFADRKDAARRAWQEVSGIRQGNVLEDPTLQSSGG
jgi:1-acyl-sn-glycerol-3-phosphate acyltransferase